jgi:hypothetical protein
VQVCSGSARHTSASWNGNNSSPKSPNSTSSWATARQSANSNHQKKRTVGILADRFDTTPDELRTRITATHSAYETLRQPDGAQIEVFYRAGDRVFSFYRFDDIAVVGLYSHSRARGAAVPVFVCARPGELYEFIQDELAVILDQSRLA